MNQLRSGLKLALERGCAGREKNQLAIQTQVWGIYFALYCVVQPVSRGELGICYQCQQDAKLHTLIFTLVLAWFPLSALECLGTMGVPESHYMYKGNVSQSYWAV